jgi:hypothetical protein
VTPGQRWPLVTRVRKARYPGTCPACGGPVCVGQRIAYTGGQWIHVTCVISHQAAGPQPEERPA